MIRLNVYRIAVCFVLSSSLSISCAGWKRSKVKSELDRLNVEVQKYQQASQAEKIEIEAAVANLQAKAEYLEKYKDKSELENEALKLEIEKLKTSLEKKQLLFLLEESVSSAEVQIGEFDNMPEQKQVEFQSFLEDIETKALSFSQKYLEDAETSERYLMRVDTLKRKISGYIKLDEVRTRLEKHWSEIDSYSEASKIDLVAMNQEAQSLAPIIREIYEILPQEIEKLNTLLKEVAELKSIVEYQSIKAEYHKCMAMVAKVESVVAEKASKCNEADAMYSKCLSEVGEKKAGGTILGMLGGIALGALLAPFTGGTSLVIAGAGAVGGGIGYVSQSKSKCGEPPKCIKDAYSLIPPTLEELGLQQYPFCGVEPKKEDYLASAFIPLLIEIPEKQADISEQEKSVINMHNGFASGLQLAEDEVMEVKEGVMFFISEYEKAATLFSEAEGNWQEAQKTYGNASKKYMEAKTKYDEAAKEFNMVATTLIVLAASAAVSELVCATKMPTDTFRKKLVSAGVNVEGKHVDHIIPSAKGGADHPLNYQLWDASKNMSCGAGCLPEKFIASPPKFLMALAVSAITALNCGG